MLSKKARLTGTLLMCMAFLAAIYALQGVLLSGIIAEYSLTDASQGLSAMAACAGGFAALASSFCLIGRVKRMTLLKAALLICAVFLSLLPFAKVYSVFVALWFLAGIGMGFIDMLLSSCIADLFTGKTATRMMCVLHMVYGISGVIVPVLDAALLKLMVWNRLYRVTASVGLVLFVLLCTVTRGGDAQAVTDGRLPLSGMIELIRHRTVPILAAAMLFHGIFLGGMNAWVNRYVGVTLGSGLGAYAMSCMFFGVLLSRIVVPMLPFGTEKYVCVGGVLAGAAVAVALPFGNGLLMCACTALSGFLFGALIPCLLDIGCAREAGNSMFVTTCMMLLYYIGQSASSPIVGAMEGAFGLTSGMALCAVCMVMSSVLAGGALKTRR